MVERLSFVTTSLDKVLQVRQVFGNGIEHIDYEIPEYQDTYLEDIVRQKAIDAFKIYRKPVLVDDTSLAISCLGGMPGPFVKHELAHGGVYAILDKIKGKELRVGQLDRTAFAQVMFGLHDNENVSIFNGVVRGKISKYPKGNNGFGFDSIFIPEGFTRTRGELEGADFETTSPRSKALILLQRHLSS